MEKKLLPLPIYIGLWLFALFWTCHKNDSLPIKLVESVERAALIEEFIPDTSGDAELFSLKYDNC